MKCILVKSDCMDDWFTIERAEHDNKEWYEATEYGSSFHMSCRLSYDSCIEGSAKEMLAIAKAIHDEESVGFRRCAAYKVTNGYLMSSPRNSTNPCLISFEDAQNLADDINNKLKELKQNTV